MDLHDPYAPPQEDFLAPRKRKKNRRGSDWDPEPLIQRHGNRAIIPSTGCTFPDRCVRCNQPATKRYRKTLFWHPPLVYLGLLLGALPYIIFASLVRKSTNVDYGLCDAHRSQRTMGILVGTVGTLGAIALMILGIDHDVSNLSSLGVVLLVACPIAGVFMAGRMVVATKIDEKYAWLSVGGPFLSSLPPADF